ncbi:MAG: ABC transporter ATP-binding protein [Desulfurococcus sp.]|nr:ABC transporter ATP-binding protein [Desulfurococcus sp.]
MVYLKINNVEFWYRSFKVLSNITFEVCKGEVLSVVGPNASGKTTLLKVIDGILKPQQGSVYVDGKNLQDFKRLEVAKLIGYVPQRLNVIQPLTVYDFVMTGRKPYIAFTPTKMDRDAVLEAIKVVQLSDKLSRSITELSGGEFQRALIARALAANPQILLLDEPTANLDPYYQIEILKLIVKLARSKNILVIMALHDLTHAYKYSDKILIMKNGAIYAAGSPDEVLTPENIYSVYGVRVHVIRDLKSIVVVE